ncbi:MAG TPA: hypothetical protein P5248_12970, partial [Bacteroidales bacterium]|nr:hypothetical protein [Bacteroidales bacterium]
MVFLLGGIATAAIVTQNITYQGVLTDSSGSPLNGNYQMTFRLYEVVSGGSPLGTSGPVSVTVTNGLFTSPVTFDSQYYDGRALWIGIAVGSDSEMTPRQELRPVPYAMSLRPGALINGTGLNYILKVDNSGGTGSGVWANTSSGVAIRGESAQSAGIYGKGKLGGFFTTNQGGTSSAWAGLAPGVDIQTTFPFNPALRVMTRGNDSYGVYSQTTGLRSVGIMGESDQDVGVYGKGTTGGYFTTNREGIGVHSVTSYDYSPGIQSSTHGRSSIGIAIETTGLSSRGLDVRTYNAGGLGIYSETKGEGSAGLLVRTLNKTSRGIYSETNGESSTGI